MEIKIDKLPAPESVPGRIVALVVAEDHATQGAIREALTESNPNCEKRVLRIEKRSIR